MLKALAVTILIGLALALLIGLILAYTSGDIESDPPQDCYQMHVVNLNRPPGEREFSFTFNAQNDEPLEVEQVPAPGTWIGGAADRLKLEYDDTSRKWNFLICGGSGGDRSCLAAYTIPGASKTVVPPAGTWISNIPTYQTGANEEVTGSRLTCPRGLGAAPDAAVPSQPEPTEA